MDSSLSLKEECLKLDKLIESYEVNTEDPLVIERKALLSKILSYLEPHRVLVSRETLMDKLVTGCVNILGKGTFGSIFKIDYQGSLFAMKRIKLSGLKEYDGKILMEIDNNQTFSHPNVISFFYYCIEFDVFNTPWMNLFIELCTQDLSAWLKDKTNEKTFHVKKAMFLDICNGIEYIHSRGLIHRNLKPTNILIDLKGVGKISDYGLSILIEEQFGGQANFYLTRSVGAPVYSAPEQLATSDYNSKADVFSLGLIFMETLAEFSNDIQTISALKNLREVDVKILLYNKPIKSRVRVLPQIITEKYPAESMLIMNMTEHNADLRPSIEQIIATVDGFGDQTEIYSNKIASTENVEEIPPSIRSSLYTIGNSNSSERNESLAERMEKRINFRFSYLKKFEFETKDPISLNNSKLMLFKKGTFSTISRLINKKQEFAIKKRKLIGDRNKDKILLNEMRKIYNFSHLNVINFYGSWIEVDNDRNHYSIIRMEFCSEDLETLLKKDSSITHKKRIKMMLGISRGLAYIHKMNYVHRNLKTCNILISNEGVCKIAGFSLIILEKKIDKTTYDKDFQGRDTSFHAPELRPGSIYDHKVDIFAFGLIIMLIFTNPKDEWQKRQLFRNIKIDRKLADIFKKEELKALGQIILNMTDRSPTKRAGAKIKKDMLK